MDKKEEIKLLKRQPFRWQLNGKVCRWCYEMFDLESVLEIHNLKLVEKIDDDSAWVTGELQ